jgi:hypothetical protein
MKLNPWTVALISAGVIGAASTARAEEKPSTILTSVSPTTLSGYVDTSAQWNIGTGHELTPTYAFGGPGKADGFNLNVAKISLERPIDPAETWSAGYKVDLITGPDANALATQSSGIGADFGIKQAYVALHAPVGNGLDAKLGVWDTIIGYESFESPNDPNFTRSYGYTIEPTTHTGLLLSYQVCDAVVLSGGIADTFGPKINERANPPKAESFKTYMASITFTAPTNMGVLSGSTLSGCVISGYNSFLGADETSWYVGGTLATPITGLKVGASYDYLGVSKQPLSSSGYANAVAGYVSFQATEKLAVLGRVEYATSDLMATYTFGDTSGVRDILGARKVVAATATLQYDLWKNVLSRVEFRWDRAVDGSQAFGNIAPDKSEVLTGTKKNSFILLGNIVYKF